VTYGGFARRDDGYRFPETEQIGADLALIAATGLNTVRLYDIPPPEMLDMSAAFELRLIVGLGGDDWRMERDVGRAARRRILASGRRSVEKAMSLCAGRGEVMAIAVGNEIPVDLVRLHGAVDVSAVLSELIAEVHSLDPEMMATYVNFPTTEFLDPVGQDLVCFNVFLEDEDTFRRYVRHLQVVSSTRPLLLTEIGLAAEVHGESAQANLLDTQLRVLDEEGVAGATVYGWTDEWAVNDEPVTGWGFGITDAERAPKAALTHVEEWCKRTSIDLNDDWPLVTVVVCAYNEERTLGECLDSIAASTYPNLEVIICDDGSTDRTADIASRYSFKLLQLPHGGLSRARNAGLDAASGEIIAYLDADAACHPEWPFHLVLSIDQDVAATGGPNLTSTEAGFVERAVARSPGPPAEVLIADDRAEHVPGCNMAFSTEALKAIGGFENAYTAAGDDVDVCWKLLDGGAQIAFSPAAQIRHHRRSTVSGYLKQQRGYGRAERMLSGPHRGRFNRLGQASWEGSIYGGSRVMPSLLRPVVYHGRQGLAQYQRVIEQRSAVAASWAGALLPLMLLFAAIGAALALLSPWWLILTVASIIAVIAYSLAIAIALPSEPDESHPVLARALVGSLHVMQPFARMWGRLRTRPLPRAERSHPWLGDRPDWLKRLASQLRSSGVKVREGGPSQGWDLQISVGPFLSMRLNVAVVWRWEPRWRARYAPRWSVSLLLIASAGLAILSPWYGVGVLTAAALWTIVEFVRSRSKVIAGIKETTRGATVGATEER
jgi:glycosyltransferase involved in cell wall biosynthesis